MRSFVYSVRSFLCPVESVRKWKTACVIPTIMAPVMRFGHMADRFHDLRRQGFLSDVSSRVPDKNIPWHCAPASSVLRSPLTEAIPKFAKLLCVCWKSAVAALQQPLGIPTADTNQVIQLCTLDTVLEKSRERSLTQVKPGSSSCEALCCQCRKECACAFDRSIRRCAQDWGRSRVLCVCFTPLKSHSLCAGDVAGLVSLGCVLLADLRVQSPLPQVTGKAAAKSGEDVRCHSACTIRRRSLYGRPRA